MAEKRRQATPPYLRRLFYDPFRILPQNFKSNSSGQVTSPLNPEITLGKIKFWFGSRNVNNECRGSVVKYQRLIFINLPATWERLEEPLEPLKRRFHGIFYMDEGADPVMEAYRSIRSVG